MNIRRVARSLPVVFISAAIGVGISTPAAEAHGAKSETYTANAPAPFPAPAGCIHGEDVANIDTHPFQMPVSGRLTVELTNFTGDWDLYLEQGAVPRPHGVVASSTGGGNIKTVSYYVYANVEINIVACNFAGGPTATVSFTFTRMTRVAVGDVAVHEGDAGTRTAVFNVSLVQPSKSPVSVNYATALPLNGTPPRAAAGSDYTAKSGTLTFAPGTTSAKVKVPIVGDAADEANEAFNLVLSSPIGVHIADSEGLGTILDDDPSTVVEPRLAIGDAAAWEGNSGSRSAVFTVSLSKAATSAVAVSYATVKGTAIGKDFTATSGTLSFAPGVTSLTVKVAITPDLAEEGNETFDVALSNVTGAVLTDATGVGTILDGLEID